jgi:hypothetical protein
MIAQLFLSALLLGILFYAWIEYRRSPAVGIYVWIVISLLIFLNLHLKLRSQMELITDLAREIALLKV